MSTCRGQGHPRLVPLRKLSSRLNPFWRSCGAVVLAGMVAACSNKSAGPPLPPGPPLVSVEMDEFRFSYKPPIPSGRVVFNVTNVGKRRHVLALLALAEDLPPIDQQLKGPDRAFITPFAGVARVEPGTKGAFAVDLAPGVRYAMICTVRAADGQTHALKGMNSEFRAGPDPTQSKPTADR